MADQFPHPFGKIAKQFRKFRKELPVEASRIAVNDFKENFRRGGYRTDSGLQKWKRRSRTKNKRDGSRAILVKSGRLKRSLRAEPTYNEARVVTNVPYAQAHNEGYKGTVKVRAHSRYKWKSGLVKAKSKSGKTRMRSVKERTKRIKVRAHSRKVNMPARPFMITTPPLIRAINHHVEREIDKIFNA